MPIYNSKYNRLLCRRFFCGNFEKLFECRGVDQLIFGRVTEAEKSKVSVTNIKVWSTFSKVVGVGNAHKYFMLLQILIAKRLAVWRIEHNGESQCDSNKKKSYATKTTNLPLFKGKLATHANFCILYSIFSLRPLKCDFLTFCHLLILTFVLF